MAIPRLRLDALLVARSLADDLRSAQGLILAGQVLVDDRPQDKPGTAVRADAVVRLRGERSGPYVSRGGLKLQGALQALGLDVSGLHCADIGASTGGFTDCLLQHGAAAVWAVDVGYGLLAEKLRQDPRVIIRDRTHARDLTPSDKPFALDLITVDVSFIAARTLLPALATLVDAGGRLLVMVKPQFELAAHEVGAGGVVRDEAERATAVQRFLAAAASSGLQLESQADSEVAGPAGNREVFVLLRVAQREPVAVRP
jgi:23S rRNA (cytidine1920-2'-O)/16S rRNA (cytidine1409-2'-O)-methyltransferase